MVMITKRTFCAGALPSLAIKPNVAAEKRVRVLMAAVEMGVPKTAANMGTTARTPK
jgi:hypothetical protein